LPPAWRELGRRLLAAPREPRLTPLPPLPPQVYLRRPFSSLPFPLDEPSSRLLAWGRHAVWHGVRALGLKPGDEILIPAYHHGSEVEALLRAGLTPRFYDSSDRLEPDLETLESLLSARVRAIYLIHYLGFPQDGARWRRWCDERGLLLIEDAAQAWLTSHGGHPVGSYGDASFFCLYKTFGLLEGAALRCPNPPQQRELDPRLGLVPLARKHALWLAGRSRGLAGLAAALTRAGERETAAEEFDFRNPTEMPWRTTRFLLRRIADPTAAEQRRKNYSAMLERFGEFVPIPFRNLPAGASPMAFPLTVKDKRWVVDGLLRRNIKSLDFWSFPHPSLPVEDFPRAAQLRASIVALPIHQELRSTDIERMSSAISELLASVDRTASNRL
jgi:dTDP-4-amino-4,6-dideoxygalactose transaminase